MKYAAKTALTLAAAVLTLMAGPSMAQDAAPAAGTEAAPIALGANLNISPKRLTFDRAGKSATVYIFNQGTAPATFDISLVDRFMDPSGQISSVTDAQGKAEMGAYVSKLQSAKPMLMVTPRRATLEPGKGQTIRVRVNPAASGAPASGEYRTHLTVTTVPPRDVGLTAEQAAQTGPEELSFTIYSVFGVSIPLVVRLGETDVRAAIENPQLTYADISPDGTAPAVRTPVLSFDLARLGANSLFGNVEVRTKSGGKDPIGIARGVGVYPEIDKRRMQIPLTRAPAPGETLEVTFTDDDTAPGRVLAQAAFTPR
ncbi:MAG TPA: hypothetical protein VD906_13005 [Caulobacteraceae bacterium]|nr:hypothetical protein [Caulobacteraceae bacterium]